MTELPTWSGAVRGGVRSNKQVLRVSGVTEHFARKQD